MQYCLRCLYPSNHALGITFDESGICSGCRIHKEKDTNIWQDKQDELRIVLKQYKSKSGRHHDCIIPVSGGKDSIFIAHTIKYMYGLNPLLVSYNRYYNTAGGVYNLETLRSKIGCDIITQTPNPERLKRLTRMSLDMVGSIHWPYLAGRSTFPVQVSARKGIPLIIWGAHQGLEQVGMFSHKDNIEMSKWYRNEHDLLGLIPEELVEKDHGLHQGDLAPLHYPDDDTLQKEGVRGIYLGNYIRWDTKAQHENMHELYPVYRAPQTRTFDNYSDPDCLIYNSIHDEIKFRKFGYSVVNDHVAREIRYGRITTAQGAKLIAKYSLQSTLAVNTTSHVLDLSAKEILQSVDNHRDLRAWEKIDNEWKLRDPLDLDNISKQADELASTAKYSSYIPHKVMPDTEHRVLLKGGA